VLEARRRHPGCRVLGARHGVRGIRDGDYVDLVPALRGRAAPYRGDAERGPRQRPATSPTRPIARLILKGLKSAGADAFIYIGGNDTAGTQQILADASGGDIAFVHAPKTIDNDLEESDHTPGFISAAEFVAGAFLSVDLDFRALPGIYAGIVMGRHAGFLTAASAAWRLDEDSGPHLIYVPERPFERARFVDEVKSTMARHGRCIVAISEGISSASGRSMVEELVPADMLERDAHGNVRLSGTDLGQAIERILADDLKGTRARVDTFGYLPRGNIGMISAVDAQEAFDAGVFAVDAAARGGGSVALQEEGGKTVIRLVPLSAVAGKTRHIPANFLDANESRLSPDGHAYLDRLLPRKFEPGTPFV
jgi:6-phosphofructokinase